MSVAKPLLLVIAIGLCPARASADAKEEAKLHFGRASIAYKEGRFSEALSEMMTSYALDPRSDLLFAIGQIHVKLGQCPQAISFYERFIAANPNPGPADAATEAIKICRVVIATQQNQTTTTKPEPATNPNPATPTPPAEARPAPAPAPEPDVRTPSRWYADGLGAALVGTGLVSGVLGIFFYGSARSTLDEADQARDLGTHLGLVDEAGTKRTFAIVFTAGGVALVGAGVLRLVMRDRGEEAPALAIVPASGGGQVTWSARF